jgi:hypothetical protein
LAASVGLVPRGEQAMPDELVADFSLERLRSTTLAAPA